MIAKKMYMDYGFMKQVIGEFRCNGEEIDDDTPVFVCLASKTRDNSLILCVAEIECKCGKHHLLESGRTIQEQLDEFMGEIKENNGIMEDKEIQQYITDDDYWSRVKPSDKAQVFPFENKWTSDEVNFFDSTYDYVNFYKTDCTHARIDIFARSLRSSSDLEELYSELKDLGYDEEYCSSIFPDREEYETDRIQLVYCPNFYTFERIIHNGKEYTRVNNGEKATSYILSSSLQDVLYIVVKWKKVEKGFVPWEGMEIEKSAYYGIGSGIVYKTREDAEKVILELRN